MAAGRRRIALDTMTDREWKDHRPIYRQLRDRVVALILDRVLADGDPLPSVRTVAAEFRINPLTVLKAYQQLADERLVETRRGLGMFVLGGARDLLLHSERAKFLSDDWPAIAETIDRLGLTIEHLLAAGPIPSQPDEVPTHAVHPSKRPA